MDSSRQIAASQWVAIRRLLILTALTWFSLATLAAAGQIEIRGQLLGAGGKPLAGAELLLLPHPSVAELAALQREGRFEPAPAVHARSGDDGSFRLLAPEPGFWKLIARQPQHLDAAAYLTPLLDDVELAPIELPPRREIAVHVAASDGSPLAGAEVLGRGWLESWTQEGFRGWWLQTRSATSGPDGIAYLATTRGEHLTVSALADGHFGHKALDESAAEVRLVLDRPLRELRLIDTRNRPLAGVGAASSWPFLALGISDEQGRLLLPEPATGLPLQLVREIVIEPMPEPINPPSTASASAHAASDRGEQRQLPAAETFDLEIVDVLTRNPLAGAFVWGNGGHRRSDARGRLRLELPPAELAKLGVVAPGYFRRVIGEPGHPPDSREPVVVALVPVIALSGRVRDPAGQPIAGAAVKLGPGNGFYHAFERLPRHHWIEPRETTTDTEGRFQLTRVTPTVNLRLDVRRAGFARRQVELPPIEPGAPADLGTLVLERGVTLEGKVVDTENHPLAGVDLGIHRRDLMTSSARWSAEVRNEKLTTDGEGRFRVDAVPSAAVLEIWTYHPGFQPKNLSGVRPALEGSLTITLEPAAAVVFRVVDGAGTPVAGANVQLVHLTPGSEMTTWSRTDEQGRADFQQLAPGEVMVSARGELGVAPPRRVEISAGHEPVEVRLALLPAARLTGKVLGEDGEPIAGVGVMARRLDGDAADAAPDNASAPFAHALSADDGRFALPGLESGRWQVEASRDGIKAASMEVSLATGEQREVEIVLRGHAMKLEGRVLGRVLDSTGAPVAGAVVALLVQPDNRRVGEAPSGADGSFELRAPLRSSFEVFARHPRAGSALSEPFELDLGETRDLELVLGLGGVIEGELLGLSLVQLGSVQVVASLGALRFGAIVRHDGSYRFEKLPPGEWQLSANSPLTQYVHPEPIVLTGEGEVVAVDLPIGAQQLLRGSVWVAGGSAEGVVIAAVCSTLGTTASTVSRSDGSFVLAVAPSQCELRIDDPKTGLSVQATIDPSAPEGVPSTPLLAVDPATGTELRVELEP